MQKRVRWIFVLWSFIVFPHCGSTVFNPDYLSVSGADVTLSDGTATTFSNNQFISLIPSDSFPPKHIQLNEAPTPGKFLLLQFSMGTLEPNEWLFVWAPDDEPNNLLAFSPPGFDFPFEWRLRDTNAPGVYEVSVPAVSGTLTVHQMSPLGSIQMIPPFTAEVSCDDACDHKICCGSADCIELRASVCLSYASDQIACWDCLCEMAWGCLSHDFEKCKDTCDHCNANTWPHTDYHCTHGL